MSYIFYKTVHLFGVFMLVSSLSGLAWVRFVGQTPEKAVRKLGSITHGIGLFLALLGGFGMLARLQIHWPWPGWIIAKFVIWILLGATLPLILRRPLVKWHMWFPLIFATAAAYLAIAKPF